LGLALGFAPTQTFSKATNVGACAPKGDTGRRLSRRSTFGVAPKLALVQLHTYNHNPLDLRATYTYLIVIGIQVLCGLGAHTRGGNVEEVLTTESVKASHPVFKIACLSVRSPFKLSLSQTDTSIYPDLVPQYIEVCYLSSSVVR
jgi:hypothetical protein